MTEPTMPGAAGPQHEPPETTSPGKQRNPRRWPWVVIAPVALILGVGIGVATQPEPEKVEVPTAATAHEKTQMSQQADKLDNRSDKLAGREKSLDNRKGKLDDREDKFDERVDDVEEQENDLDDRLETVEQNTITDGVWTVGDDVEPGSYRASDVSSDCYWQITKGGSNGSDIIENDIPGGGNPSVTLSDGQEFTSQRCGEWHKQE